MDEGLDDAMTWLAELIGPSPVGQRAKLLLDELLRGRACARDMHLVMEGLLAVASHDDQHPDDATLDQVLDAVRRHWRG